MCYFREVRKVKRAPPSVIRNNNKPLIRIGDILNTREPYGSKTRAAYIRIIIIMSPVSEYGVKIAHLIPTTRSNQFSGNRFGPSRRGSSVVLLRLHHQPCTGRLIKYVKDVSAESCSPYTAMIPVKCYRRNFAHYYQMSSPPYVHGNAEMYL